MDALSPRSSIISPISFLSLTRTTSYILLSPIFSATISGPLTFTILPTFKSFFCIMLILSVKQNIRADSLFHVASYAVHTKAVAALSRRNGNDGGIRTRLISLNDVADFFGDLFGNEYDRAVPREFFKD